MWIGDVPAYLRHLSTCRVFRDIRAYGCHNLQDMRDTKKVGQDDSIWTSININAYYKASTLRDLSLTLLPSGRLVASSVMENSDLKYTPHSLPEDKDITIMGDLKPNVWIKGVFNTSHIWMLRPEDNGFFIIHHLSD